MTTQELFQQAVEDSKLLSSRPSNDTLLKLYGLYKQATEGDAPDTSPAGPFDFIGKAKYGAWEELGGLSQEVAMQQYTELVGKLKG